MKRVAIIPIGSELLDGQIVDTNSQMISQVVTDLMGQVVFNLGCSDVEEHILELLEFSISSVDLIITIGGLGPTSDDLTRNIVSQFSGKNLCRDTISLAKVSEAVNSRGLELLEGHKRQADFPEGAIVFENKKGTANAFAIELNSGKQVLALPGPPREIKSCLENGLRDYLASFLRIDQKPVYSSHCFIGVGESQIADYVESQMPDAASFVAYRASSPFVEVKIRCNPDQFKTIEEAWGRFSGKFSLFRVSSSISEFEEEVNSFLLKLEHVLILDKTKGLAFLGQFISSKDRLRRLDQNFSYTKSESVFEAHRKSNPQSSYLNLIIKSVEDGVQFSYEFKGQKKELKINGNFKKSSSSSFSSLAINQLFAELLKQK